MMFSTLANLPDGARLCGMRVNIEQASDSCDRDSAGQGLEIHVVDAGGGAYAVLSTDRWAMEPRGAQWLAECITELCAACEEDGDTQ